mmetsp:Transcript_109591/g.274548  ORF Transcript_109591/g.274548 Transcript_109591/m.274548 type:complete len:221 (-) Transcript_109591:473-1135(-)
MNKKQSLPRPQAAHPLRGRASLMLLLSPPPPPPPPSPPAAFSALFSAAAAVAEIAAAAWGGTLARPDPDLRRRSTISWICACHASQSTAAVAEVAADAVADGAAAVAGAEVPERAAAAAAEAMGSVRSLLTADRFVVGPAAWASSAAAEPPSEEPLPTSSLLRAPPPAPTALVWLLLVAPGPLAALATAPDATDVGAAAPCSSLSSLKMHSRHWSITARE